MTIGRGILMTIGVTAMTILAGCSGSAPDTTPAENVQGNAKAAPAPSAIPPAENTAEAETNKLAVPPEAPIPADQQMMDDASATGMTAHVSRDEGKPDAQPN